jgi:hypothetical protein
MLPLVSHSPGFSPGFKLLSGNAQFLIHLFAESPDKRLLQEFVDINTFSLTIGTSRGTDRLLIIIHRPETGELFYLRGEQMT